jgi:hypothetical protein
MNTRTLVDKSGAYCVSQSKSPAEPKSTASLLRLNPAITISHQTGAGAPEIAGQLAPALQRGEFAGKQPWAVYNHQIIENALDEKRWPRHLAAKITEEKRFFIDELIDDVLDLRPPSWVMMPQMVDTTLRLAREGHAILVGHGATIVTSNLPNVFHVRLTGSLAKRIERVQRLEGFTPEAAFEFVRAEDRRRNKFLRAHFHARLDNELLYDLAINTDRLSDEDAVALISEGAQRFFARS